MVMHQHTKFHYKSLSGSEDSIWTNIPQTIWTVAVPLTMSHDSLRFTMHHYTKFGCKSYRTSGDMEKSNFLTIWACTVTLTLKIGTQTFGITLQVVMMQLHEHAKFHTERFNGSEDIVRTNIPPRTWTLIVTRSWLCTIIPSLVANSVV